MLCSRYELARTRLLEKGLRVPYAAAHRCVRQLRKICRRGLRSSKNLPPAFRLLFFVMPRDLQSEDLSLVQREPAAGD